MDAENKNQLTKGSGQQEVKEITIPREEAVFWLDSRGYWRNDGGKFRKKKIIDHFNAAISKDEHGYFLCQQKGDVFEKVYFPYEDTALFVFDVDFETGGPAPDITLVLNTRRKLSLNPRRLYIQNDCLYVKENDDIIKFTERALMKLSAVLDEKNGQFCIHASGSEHPIPELD